MSDTVPSTAHHHYNPDWLTDDALVSNFVARQEEFSFLRGELARAPQQGGVQHYLLVGARGAGKTTLLKRLAVAIRRDADLHDHLIALSFPEELYQVKNLSDFWWAACEALVDELDRKDNTQAADRLMDAVTLAKKAKLPTDPLSDAGFQLLQQTCASLHLRPVLLVDNLDMVFQRIDKSGRKLKDPHSPAYWALREALSTTTSPIVIGGSVRLSEPFTDYDKAFYDFFIPKRLGKLGLNEVREVLNRLTDAQNLPEVKQRLQDRPGRLQTLYELTGGNPRALGLIFELLRQGPNSRAVEDFERLMDITTPYFKARFEDLAEQAQVVVHALAVGRPDGGAGLRFGLTAAEIGTHAGLPTSTVSAQLDPLEREGLVEKSASHGRTQYRMAEQLFRLWLQMRGNRRVRQNVMGLTQFLEAMFSVDELQTGVQKAQSASFLAQARYAFAFAETSDAVHLRHGLKAKAADYIVQYLKAQGGSIDDYVVAGDLPENVEALARLRDKLGQCRDGLTEDEQDALLGSIQLSQGEKNASVQALCTATTAAAELDALRPKLVQEHAYLLNAGLTDVDLSMLFHARALGCLALPHLTPQETESACMAVNDPAALRSMVWRLLGVRKIASISDEATANDWVAWGLQHALGATHSEWVYVASELGLSGFSKCAQQALEQAFTKGESFYGWLIQGLTLEDLNGEAVEINHAFSKAIEFDGKNASAWYFLGSSLRREGRHAEAEDAFRQALKLRPEDTNYWWTLAVTLSEQNRLTEAFEASKKSIEFDKNPDKFIYDWHVELHTRLCTSNALQALEASNASALRDALNQLFTASTDLPSALVNGHFVESFLAVVLQQAQATTVRDILVDLGITRHARPLLLAFEAAIENRPDMLRELEPEIQSAALQMYKRLTDEISL